jgi:hypothetical protein
MLQDFIISWNHDRCEGTQTYARNSHKDEEWGAGFGGWGGVRKMRWTRNSHKERGLSVLFLMCWRYETGCNSLRSLLSKKWAIPTDHLRVT